MELQGVWVHSSLAKTKLASPSTLEHVSTQEIDCSIRTR